MNELELCNQEDAAALVGFAGRYVGMGFNMDETRTWFNWTLGGGMDYLGCGIPC